MNRINKKWLMIALLWCLLIAIATRLPFFTGDSTEQLLHNPLFDSKIVNIFVRKSVHVVAFGLLAIFFVLAFRRVNYKYVIAWFLATCYGAIDEWHQSFIPNRDGILSDVFIDSLGAVLALLTFFVISTLYKRKSML